MKLVSKLALAAALAVPCIAPHFARAEDAAAPSTEPVKYNNGALTFTGGVDLASAYYFRGFLQENRGFIVEPYFGINATIVDADDYKIGLTLSTWNSVHSKHTGQDGGSGPDVWYENDLIASVPITFKTGVGDLTVAPTYYVYQYPNGAFNTIQEAQVLVNFDDSKAWKMISPDFPDWFKLSPYVLVAYELQDGNGSENGYAEFGIVPSYTFSFDNGFKLPISVPVTLGTGWDNYYVSTGGGNDFFGFLSIGVQTTIPLNEILNIDAKYGTIGFTAGGYYMTLFSDSVEETNNDASNVFWGKVGLTYAY